MNIISILRRYKISVSLRNTKNSHILQYPLWLLQWSQCRTWQRNTTVVIPSQMLKIPEKASKGKEFWSKVYLIFIVVSYIKGYL